MWREADAIRTLFVHAADGFVKHQGGSVQIWAADRDWFLEEWGRDTFISLPGLLLATGRFHEARTNIRAFARFEREGLLPNRVPVAAGGREVRIDPAEYNTADAPMWFIQAVRSTTLASRDWDFAAEMAPVMCRIVDKVVTGTGYRRYKRFNRIYMDGDALVVTPAQATWMDADPDGRDRPVTPRHGKAVEINALWYANLRFLATVERRLGNEAHAAGRDALAMRVKQSFNARFWFTTEENRRAWGGDGGALRDVVDGDPRGDQIRPNMVLAVSHGGDLLSPARQRSVVLAATRDLLTRYGLRTLSHRDPHYCERYDTSQPPLVKDQAYHQGTAWPWLMGPYGDALARVRRAQGWGEARIRAELQALLAPLVQFLVTHPDGSLPEVFDGGRPEAALAVFSLDDLGGLDHAFASLPDQARGGTRSQAWSVAEVLRLLVDHHLVPGPGPGPSAPSSPSPHP